MVCDAKRRRVRLLQPSASALHLDAASPFPDGSFSYFRLPASPLLRLSGLTLDGSSFGSHSVLVNPFSSDVLVNLVNLPIDSRADVQVARTARVRELKEAVECLFSRPSKDATTSWYDRLALFLAFAIRLGINMCTQMFSLCDECHKIPLYSQRLFFYVNICCAGSHLGL